MKIVSMISLFSLFTLTALADTGPKPDQAAVYFAQESKLAAQGNVDAEECLCWLYAEGFGTTVDVDEAFHWASLAAKAGSDAGKLDVAKSYAWGVGVKADPKKALAMTQGLVAKGYLPAETTLGIFYVTGTGVTKDSTESVRWLTKAAEAGDFEGQIRLGSFYHWGEDVKANPTEAQKWLDKAAQHESDCAAKYFFQLPFLINAYLDRGSIGPKEAYGKMGIKFTNRDGKAENIVIFQPSGNRKVDDAWAQAASRAKLPPWPKNYRTDDKVFGFWVPGTYEGLDPAFIAAIKAAVLSSTVLPKDVLLRGSKGTGNATVSFDYLDGSVSNEKITQSSDDSSEDAAAIAAVANAKYPSTPYQYARMKMPLVITVNFGTYTPAGPAVTAVPAASTH